MRLFNVIKINKTYLLLRFRGWYRMNLELNKANCMDNSEELNKLDSECKKFGISNKLIYEHMRDYNLTFQEAKMDLIKMNEFYYNYTQ